MLFENQVGWSRTGGQLAIAASELSNDLFVIAAYTGDEEFARDLRYASRAALDFVTTLRRGDNDVLIESEAIILGNALDNIRLPYC